MSSLKRAYLYVTRKKGKSVLMFAVLLVIATFALTSLSIGKSSDLAQENLRKTLGGYINLADNYSEENPYRIQAELVVLDNPEAINQAFESYTEKPITQKEIDTIMGIDGVVAYDAEIRDYIMKFADIEYIPGTIQLSPTQQRMAKASIVGTTEEVGYFRSGTLTLTQGRHFWADESNVAVISKDLAEKNGLRLGDELTLLGKNERLEDGKLYQTGETITGVTIVGIFEITDPMLKGGKTISMASQHDMLENRIFFDMSSFKQWQPGIPKGFSEVSFRVSDPIKLSDILSYIEENFLIDSQAFIIGIDNEDYAKAAAPLERLNDLIVTILAITVVVSALILSLILTMWSKNRIHETGIYLSVGIRKEAIIGQYLAEVLLIAVLAFGLSYFTSSVIAQQVGNGLLQQNVPSAQISVDIANGDAVSNDTVGGGGFFVAGQDGIQGIVPDEDGRYVPSPIEEPELPNDTQISVSIGLDSILKLYLIGFVIIIISVGVAGMTVMRLKPREILSKMS